MAVRSVFANNASYLKHFFLTRILLCKTTKYHFSSNVFNTQMYLTGNVCGRPVSTKGIYNVVVGVGLEKRSFIHCSKISESKVFRTNESIRATTVRLIDQDGKNLGIMSLKSALEIGRKSKNLVVQVRSSESETVCKLTSEQQLYTKMEETKKKHVKTSKTREIRVTGKITDHDLEIKLKKVREFLEQRNNVKIFVAHRRRQNTDMNDKRAVVNDIAERISDLGVLQGDPKPIGLGLRSIFTPRPLIK